MEFKVIDLGLIDFIPALALQKIKFKEVKEGRLTSCLILCQHLPVITLGRQAKRENILVSFDELKRRGINIYEVERGGDVTYHGPGQILVYPIFNLAFFKKDIHWFLRKLEETVIDFFKDLEVKARCIPGLTGVWVEEKKIASLGIAIKNWISFYGLSINIKKDDLANFCLIRPCGLEVKMTALEEVLGKEIKMDDLKQNLIFHFRRHFLIYHLNKASVTSNY